MKMTTSSKFALREEAAQRVGGTVTGSACMGGRGDFVLFRTGYEMKSHWSSAIFAIEIIFYNSCRDLPREFRVQKSKKDQNRRNLTDFESKVPL